MEALSYDDDNAVNHVMVLYLDYNTLDDRRND